MKFLTLKEYNLATNLLATSIKFNDCYDKVPEVQFFLCDIKNYIIPSNRKIGYANIKI